MKLGYLLFYVSDVDATLKFFQEAFGSERKFYTADANEAYGELNTGSTTLGFVSHPLAKSHGVDYVEPDPNSPPPAVDIGFVTEDVAAAYQRALAAGATSVAAPQTKSWGQTVAYVRELNGFLVTLNTPMG